MKALIACALLTALVPCQDPDPQPEPRRAVLVTGASSGIGRKTAELLAQNGFYVYAGARKQRDLDSLDALDHVEAVRLDVTVPEQITAAVETVRASGRKLHGLINNAGVLVMAPLIELEQKDLAFLLDVNLYGPYRVTKAFAPLLIESKGRVLTTGSLSGTVCWPLGGPYCISKHAVEAFTDVLAVEMERFGVSVGVVQPGNYRSKIMSTMQRRLRESGYSAEGSQYERRMGRLLTQEGDRGQFEEPDDVAACYLRALTDAQMRRRYLVVPNAREAEITLRSAFARIAEMNATQQHRFSREQLLEMLDAAMAAQK